MNTALHQTHLGALEEAGVTVLEDGVVQKGERFDGFATVLERTLIKAGLIEPPSLIDRLKRLVTR